MGWSRSMLTDCWTPSPSSSCSPGTSRRAGGILHTKPELVVDIIQEFQRRGFPFSLVLADSVYAESGPCIDTCEQWHLNYVCASIMACGCRAERASATPAGARLRGSSRMALSNLAPSYGHRRRIRFYASTIDPVTLPTDGTWFIMTNLQGDMRTMVGNCARGLSTASNKRGEGGLSRDRLPRWWEVVWSTYSLVSLQGVVLPPSNKPAVPRSSPANRFPRKLCPSSEQL